MHPGSAVGARHLPGVRLSATPGTEPLASQFVVPRGLGHGAHGDSASRTERRGHRGPRKSWWKDCKVVVRGRLCLFFLAGSAGLGSSAAAIQARHPWLAPLEQFRRGRRPCAEAARGLLKGRTSSAVLVTGVFSGRPPPGTCSGAVRKGSVTPGRPGDREFLRSTTVRDVLPSSSEGVRYPWAPR
jgi:hypothetical protein